MDLLPADIADDFDLFDWREEVTYTPYDPATDAPNAAAAVANVGALGRATDGAEQGYEDAGKVVVTSRRWHLKAADLNGLKPTKRGTITQADGTVWAVLNDATQTLAGRYACDCYRVTT